MTMPRYLSPEWLAELNQAAARDAELTALTAGVTLAIQQVVTGGPDGDVRYAVRLEDGAVRVVAGEEDSADVTVTEDHATAVAVSRGELSPQAAFITGRIRVGGDMAALMVHQAVLHQLDAVFAGVRAATTY